MRFNAFINMTCMSYRPSTDDNQRVITKGGVAISKIMLYEQVKTSECIFQVNRTVLDDVVKTTQDCFKQAGG